MPVVLPNDYQPKHPKNNNFQFLRQNQLTGIALRNTSFIFTVHCVPYIEQCIPYILCKLFILLMIYRVGIKKDQNTDLQNQKIPFSWVHRFGKAQQIENMLQALVPDFIKMHQSISPNSPERLMTNSILQKGTETR